MTKLQSKKATIRRKRLDNLSEEIRLLEIRNSCLLGSIEEAIDNNWEIVLQEEMITQRLEIMRNEGKLYNLHGDYLKVAGKP